MLVRKVRLRVPAGAAKPGPAIGQALGPLGLNMAEFCKQFNERTKNIVTSTPTPVVLSAFNNRSFTFETKTPPTSWLLKKCAGIEKGSKRPGHDVIAKLHVKHIYEIAKIKKNDEVFKNLPLEQLSKCIVGNALSMGIEVVNE